MKQTRFKANGKPVYITRIGSYIFGHPDGDKEEVLGMGSFSLLLEKVDVFDDTGHNMRFIRKYSVGWRGQPEDDHPCQCEVCQTKSAPTWWRGSDVEPTGRPQNDGKSSFLTGIL
jgi:hypothetical protein